MKIFSFIAQSAQHQAHVVQNAAPVAAEPVNPFAAYLQAPAIKPFGKLERDAFTRTGEPGRSEPLLPSFDVTFGWLLSHSPREVTDRLDGHLAEGSRKDLRQAIGLLNAAQKGRKLVFASTEGSQLSFHRHYGQALEALQSEDIPAAKIYLQRARRDIAGFQDIGGTTSSPFAL